MKFKRIILAVMVLSLAFSLFACGGSEDTKKEKPKTETETEVEDIPEVKEPEKIVYKSKLTGLPVEDEEASNRRPVAIMINNIKKALPQCGFYRGKLAIEKKAEE